MLTVTRTKRVAGALVRAQSTLTSPPPSLIAKKKPLPALKKGFSQVQKVPSTMDLEPKHILLDSLYQGYQPLILPHTPDMLVDKSRSGRPLLINILDSISLDELQQHEQEQEDDLDVDEAYHMPTMLFSKYIFNKNPETEKRLERLDKLAADADEVQAAASVLEKQVKQAADKIETRAGASSRGRQRAQFKPRQQQQKKKTPLEEENDN